MVDQFVSEFVDKFVAEFVGFQMLLDNADFGIGTE